MNCFVGEKIAIISNKPQTTRNKIQAIVTNDDCQIIFIDTPGMHSPKSKLGEVMNKAAESAINDVDAVLFLVSPEDRISDADQKIISKLKNAGAPVFLVINKIDTVEKANLLKIIDRYKEAYAFKGIVPISALKAQNTDTLLDEIKKCLPEGPKYFPEDMITDQPEQQLAAELIREKALFLLQDEVPHGLAVEIMSMKKREGRPLIDIEATIYCERDSHKGIIIGKGGAMLKNIGSKARTDIERILGSPINLQLWIKVKKDWRDSDFLIRNFGLNQK
jgi:GTP-binding protein Era